MEVIRVQRKVTLSVGATVYRIGLYKDRDCLTIAIHKIPGAQKYGTKEETMTSEI